MLLFLISAARAIIEMLGLCLLGQGALHVIAGQQRSKNDIYQLFDLLTKAPRKIVATCLPRTASQTQIGVTTFLLLLLLWVGLAFLRKII